jgi:hypothetical protein
VGILDRLRRGRASETPADPDSRVLAELRKRGADLTLARHVIHYLYFDAEEDARGAGEEIDAGGYDVTLTSPRETVPEWEVRAEATRIVGAETVPATRSWFERIATAWNGEYYSWEASPKP